MNRIAIAFSSKDRVDKTRQTLPRLLAVPEIDVHWVDGSATEAGHCFFGEWTKQQNLFFHSHVEGGSCRAIVYALTELLSDPDYDYIGLCENDILLDEDWFEPTMALFDKGADEGLKVGAVSARNFVDRVLIQREGYSVNHNLGAGFIIFTRKAAEIILRTYRTHMTSENRKIFSILSGIDIAPFWAFRDSDHMVVADWGYDRILAEHGLCSLALTPSKATHLEDLVAMGLQLVTAPVERARDGIVFDKFVRAQAHIRTGGWQIPKTTPHLCYKGEYTIFAHQLPQIGAKYQADWRYKWSLPFGCFAWCAAEAGASVSIPLYGAFTPIISGDNGASIVIDDPNPGGYRLVRLIAPQAGTIFHGIATAEAQPVIASLPFDFSVLPPL